MSVTQFRHSDGTLPAQTEVTRPAVIALFAVIAASPEVSSPGGSIARPPAPPRRPRPGEPPAPAVVPPFPPVAGVPGGAQSPPAPAEGSANPAEPSTSRSGWCSPRCRSSQCHRCRRRCVVTPASDEQTRSKNPGGTEHFHRPRPPGKRHKVPNRGTRRAAAAIQLLSQRLSAVRRPGFPPMADITARQLVPSSDDHGSSRGTEQSRLAHTMARNAPSCDDHRIVPISLRACRWPLFQRARPSSPPA